MAFEGKKYSVDRIPTGTLVFYTALTFIPLVLWGFFDFKVSIDLEQNCTGHLARAAHANTIRAAAEELIIATDYLESKQMTRGYTTIFESFRTPDEDVGFWYHNLKDSLQQLEKMPGEVSPLERSNVLLKLRETLIRAQADGDHVVHPPGLERFPNNGTWMFTLILSCLSAFIGFCMIGYIIHRD